VVGAKKNLRLLIADGLPDPRAAGMAVKSVAGGLLVQSRDNAVVDNMTLKVVTRRAPTNAELTDLAFAFRIAKHVKSNTIGLCQGPRHGRHRCRPDEPDRFRAHRRAQGRGTPPRRRGCKRR